jgi:hypothetical protein
MGTQWAEQELAGINLGDERLSKRSVKLLQRLGDKPTKGDGEPDVKTI